MLESARQWVLEFVDLYNNKHKYSRVKFVTPNQRHRGEDKVILAKRKELYENKKAEYPTRWSGTTRNWDAVGKVELNPENEVKLEPKKDAF